MSFILERRVKPIIPFIITLVAIFLLYLTPQNDPKTLIPVVFLTFIFALYRFDPRIPVVYAILLLIIAAVFTSQKMDDAVPKIAELSYWTLITGVICILIESRRKAISQQKPKFDTIH